MKKHIFVNPGKKPILGPSWIGYTCKYCKKRSGLNAWQIIDMPPSMAKCSKSPVKMGFFEKLFGSANCFKGRPAKVKLNI